MKKKKHVKQNLFYLLGVVMLFNGPNMAMAQVNDVEHYTLPENRPKNLPFSEAVRHGNTVYLAGQIGIPPGEANLVEGGIEPETDQIMKNIGLVLAHFSLTFDNLVRCQVMLADISEWPDFNGVYKTYFSKPYPARSAFASSGLAFGARAEVECVAAIPNNEGTK